MTETKLRTSPRPKTKAQKLEDILRKILETSKDEGRHPLNRLGGIAYLARFGLGMEDIKP